MELLHRGRILAACLMVSSLNAAGCEILGLDGGVEVRVRNGSSLTFDEATLFLPRVSLSFSDLVPGEATPYSTVSKAYRIASAHVVMGQDTARLQVIDYVGEQPLDDGRYTYVLSFFEGNPESLVLELVEDS